uniref:Uncharacterized protein n=1 Tax=Oryza meridionalis TaxID=40149 RepID=A0A0E0EW81_9ORYZ
MHAFTGFWPFFSRARRDAIAADKLASEARPALPPLRQEAKKGAKAALPDDDDYEPSAPPLPPGDDDDDEEPINLVFKGGDEAGGRRGGAPHRRRGSFQGNILAPVLGSTTKV